MHCLYSQQANNLSVSPLNYNTVDGCLTHSSMGCIYFDFLQQPILYCAGSVEVDIFRFWRDSVKIFINFIISRRLSTGKLLFRAGSMQKQMSFCAGSAKEECHSEIHIW